MPPSVPYGAVGEPVALSGGTLRPLASCKLFTAELLTLSGTVHVGVQDSFTSLVCLDGEAELTVDEAAPLALKKGSSVFLPAGFNAAVTGNAALLCSRV